MLEFWGRESQALRFPTEAEATTLAGGMELNASAKAYEVVYLP